MLGWEHVVIAPNFMRMSPLDFTDYPYTHSLLLMTVWGLLLAIFQYLIRRDARSSIVVFALVVSHWLLDWLVHSPDLLLYPSGSRKFGLGLWNHPWLEIPLEVGIFFTGTWIYASCTRARDAIGRYSFWSLIIALFAGWVSTLLAGAPPSVSNLARGAVIMSPIILLWAWWADLHRAAIHR